MLDENLVPYENIKLIMKAKKCMYAEAEKIYKNLRKQYMDGTKRYEGKEKQNPKNTSIIVKCITNNKTYESLRKAALDLGLSEDGVSKCCRGKIKQTGGYKFRAIS